MATFIKPKMRTITNAEGSTVYLNSGNWIENFTALELSGGVWSIYHHKDAEMPQQEEVEEELSTGQLFDNMLHEFNLMKA